MCITDSGGNAHVCTMRHATVYLSQRVGRVLVSLPIVIELMMREAYGTSTHGTNHKRGCLYVRTASFLKLFAICLSRVINDRDRINL